MLNDVQLNIHNIKKLQIEPPSEYNFLRFDSNNDCNLHCVYCHNHRSDKIIETEEFRFFLEKNIISVENFQVGCIMEPTMDPRMCDLMLFIANSPAKPKKQLILQTNGIILHKHDYGKMKEAGLNELSISIDSADQKIQKELRSGTNLNRVITNIKSLQKICPEVKLTFITTVTSHNIQQMEDLVYLGLDLGAVLFIFREVFHRPESNIVNHEKVKALLLKESDFIVMKQKLVEKFNKKTTLLFADNQQLNSSEQKIKIDSKRD